MSRDDSLLHILQSLDIMAPYGLRANDPDVGLHHLQEPRKPHQRPRRTDRTDQVVDPAACLLPYFQCRRLVMRQVIARIGKLVGHEIFVGVAGHLAAGQADRPVGSLLGGRKDHLRTIGTNYFTPLDRHGAAHHDLHGISLDDADDGQADARIARRRFDDRLAGREAPVLFGLLDHPERNAVFDAARGVETFEFRIDIDVRVGAKPVDPHHRGSPDSTQNILFYHKST